MAGIGCILHYTRCVSFAYEGHAWNECGARLPYCDLLGACVHALMLSCWLLSLLPVAQAMHATPSYCKDTLLCLL